MGARTHRAAGSSRIQAYAGHGFTLLELIVVMTILSILMVSVVPLYSNSLSRMRASHSIKDFLSVLKYAQERAVTDGIEYRLNLEPNKNLYWVSRATEDEKGRKVFKPLDDEPLGDKRALARRLEMRKPRARRDRDKGFFYIGFYPSGACDMAEITLIQYDALDAREGSFRISTKGKLGRFEVKERR